MSNIVDINKKRDQKKTTDNKERTFEDIVRASTTEDGAIDLSTFSSFEREPVGYNGGVACDVTKGPCSCGAWH